MKIATACLAFLFVLAGCGQAPLAASVPDEPALITVFGAIDAPPDRAGFDPQTEPLFAQYGLGFDTAVGLRWSQLAALEQYAVDVDFPSGGPVRHFSGPLMRDVMALVQPSEDGILLTALDGYQRRLDLLTLSAHDVVLAIRLDGRPLSLGGFGPAMVVWPRSVDPVLFGMPDDDWVWGVFAIEVRGEMPVAAP
jgi:hypothetical protein